MRVHKRRKFPVLLVGVIFLIILNVLFLFLIIKAQEGLVPAQVLTEQEYLQKKAEYIQVLNNSNPREALFALQEDIKNDNSLSRSCHILTHEIGHVSYKKYKTFGKAMEYASEICNSGYLHGLIETHFKSEEDILATMPTLCKDYAVDTFIGWQCNHGIGHGLMYFTFNDLYKSLDLCERLNSKFAQSNCVNGVYMENFNTEQKLHPSKYLKEDEPFYPCSEQKEINKSHCYYYAPVYFLALHKNAYDLAIKECLSIEENYVRYCVTGVGGQMMKENINNPNLVEQTCMNYENSVSISCLSGMVGIYINHYGLIQKGEELCEKLSEYNQEYCYTVVKGKRAQFL